jgi:two-component system, cell cycle sensor histidine kinase and response regulator CckA
MLPLESLQPPAVLASPRESELDRLAKLAVRIVGATAGLISLASDEGELADLCREAGAGRGPLRAVDALAHPLLRGHEIVRALGIRGLLAIPLPVEDEAPLGVLCVVDAKPRVWTDDEEELLVEVAAAIVTRLGLRTAVEQAHEAAEERQAVLASSLDCILVMDDEGVVRDWNPAAERTFGWSREEAIGRRLGDLIVPEHLRERHEEGLARAAATGESRIIGQRLRLPALRKDGTTFVSELAITRLERNGRALFTGTIRDLTEIVRAEEEKAAADARYRGLVEQLPLLTYVTSCANPPETLYVSPQAEAMLGYPLQDWLDGGSEFFERIVHPDDFEAFLAERSSARTTEQGFSLNYRLLAADGRVVWVLDESLVLVDDDGSPLYCQGFLFDITERKQLEEQLRQSQKMEAIGQLAGGIAHDFNNMLTAITGYAELLGYSFAEGDTRLDDIGELKRAAAHAAGLTRQLLAFSRKQMLKPQRLHANEVVSELEPMLRRTIGEQIDITLELAPGLAQVEADPDQLTQVVLNIALNARDAMPEGGRLTISTSAVDAGVAIVVSDTGTGMDEETLERIFEPFFTTKDTGKGTGLGLATVYGVVSQSGGRIEVESEPGAGSTFRVLLPRAAALNDLAAA